MAHVSIFGTLVWKGWGGLEEVVGRCLEGLGAGFGYIVMFETFLGLV